MLTAIVPPKSAGEVRPTVLDFSPAILAGQSVSTASVAVSVYSGVDPSPPAFTATASGNLVTVTESGGVAGTIYSVLVTLSLTGPATSPQLQYFLAVIPPAY